MPSSVTFTLNVYPIISIVDQKIKMDIHPWLKNLPGTYINNIKNPITKEILAGTTEAKNQIGLKIFIKGPIYGLDTKDELNKLWNSGSLYPKNKTNSIKI